VSPFSAFFSGADAAFIIKSLINYMPLAAVLFATAACQSRPDIKQKGRSRSDPNFIP